jgi:Virulence factor
MAELIVVSWRDIPAQVIVKAGRRTAKRPLPERFQEAIDRAAMRARLGDTDGYLGEWRRTAVGSCGDDLEAEAERAAARLEADYPQERLRELVANGGLEPQSEGSSA